MSIDCCVIVINYNGLQFIENCLDSIPRPHLFGISVVVVDNGSTDGSLELVRSKYPQLTLLTNAENLLYCRAANQGLRWGLARNARSFFLLNNDAVLAPGCLENLNEFMDGHPEAGVCQPAVLFMDTPDRVNSLGVRCTLSGRSWDKGFGERYSPGSAPKQILAATGGAMFLRASALEQVGLFPEDFGMYCEDVDLSLRMRSHGYEAYCLEQAKVFHKLHGGGGPDRDASRFYLCERNSFKVVLRNFPLGMILLSYALGVPARMATGLNMLARGETAYFLSEIKAVSHGLALLPGYALRSLLTGYWTRSQCSFARHLDWNRLFPPSLGPR